MHTDEQKVFNNESLEGIGTCQINVHSFIIYKTLKDLCISKNQVHTTQKKELTQILS